MTGSLVLNHYYTKIIVSFPFIAVSHNYAVQPGRQRIIFECISGTLQAKTAHVSRKFSQRIEEERTAQMMQVYLVLQLLITNRCLALYLTHEKGKTINEMSVL